MDKFIFIFDLDGTLIESKNSIISSFNKVFLKNKLKPTTSIEFTKLANFGSKFFIKKKFPNLKEKEINKINNQFQNTYKINCTKKIKLKKGAKHFLKRYKAKANFYIATNKPKFSSIKILKFFGIKSYFNDVYSGSNKKFKKPYGNKLREKISNFKKKNKVIVIGDSEADEKLAKINNIEFALIKNGYAKKNLKKFKRKYLFENFFELSKILLNDF